MFSEFSGKYITQVPPRCLLKHDETTTGNVVHGRPGGLPYGGHARGFSVSPQPSLGPGLQQAGVSTGILAKHAGYISLKGVFWFKNNITGFCVLWGVCYLVSPLLLDRRVL